MVAPNTASDWMEKYGKLLYIIALIAVEILTKLVNKTVETQAMTNATAKLEAVKKEQQEKYTAIESSMKSRREEYEAVVSIEDKAARLKALADFANKHNRS